MRKNQNKKYKICRFIWQNIILLINLSISLLLTIYTIIYLNNIGITTNIVPFLLVFVIFFQNNSIINLAIILLILNHKKGII